MLLSLARVLEPLGPSCVVVGGSAHYFHALTAPDASPEQMILRTNDVDVALEEVVHDSDARLESGVLSHGFQPSYSGEHVPLATRYRFENRPSHWVEFIARNKGSAKTASISGVSAARLRRVELLLLEPQRVELRREWGFETEGNEALALWVANPACFLAERLLALDRRGSSRPKDIAYIFETLRLYASELAGLAAQWRRVRPDDPKLARQLRLAAESVMLVVRDEHREALRSLQAAGRAELDAQLLIAGLRTGIPAVFFES